MSEVIRISELVLNASSYADVFGSTIADKRELVSIYRKLARVLHPDLVGETQAGLAEEAFKQLGHFFREAERAITKGSYDKTALATITTKRCKHEVIKSFTPGDLANLYIANSTKSGDEYKTVVKIVGSNADNDLLQTEARALKLLADDEGKPNPFVPELVDTFTYREVGKPNRQGLATKLLQGFYSLEEVHANYPGGLPPIDVIWIWRRILPALGIAHDKGVVHGAVVPSHILIDPANHGVVLADWAYSSIKADDDQPKIKAIVNQYRDFYPQEVLNKQTSGAATDIYMAAKCMAYLMGKEITRPFKAFFAGCTNKSVRMRPDDAWKLMIEFDDLLENLGSPYYPRRWRNFPPLSK